MTSFKKDVNASNDTYPLRASQDVHQQTAKQKEESNEFKRPSQLLNEQTTHSKAQFISKIKDRSQQRLAIKRVNLVGNYPGQQSEYF